MKWIIPLGIHTWLQLSVQRPQGVYHVIPRVSITKYVDNELRKRKRRQESIELSENGRMRSRDPSIELGVAERGPVN